MSEPHHHHHHHSRAEQGKKLLIIFFFSVGLMLIEIAGGFLSGSLALLSDAGHMLTDALAVLLSYLAIYWSRKPATATRTYGYHRTEIFASLINGITLLGVSGFIFYEAINRFVHPQLIRIDILLAVAIIGLAGNLAGMLLLRRESEDNLNIRGTFFHLLGDALSSVGVIVGGVVIAFTGWVVIDPVISILIGGIVLRSAVDLVLESGEVLLEATPRDIDIDALKKDVESIAGVRELHEIHIWTITSGLRALSGHLLIDNITTREGQKIVCAVRELLARNYNISHTTLEAECDSCTGGNASGTCIFSPDRGAP
jgi:cobalt-zinc-cadmium efflux system protein